MAYYELMSPAAFGSFNRKLAKITGLSCAVYWSEILEIINTVVRKKKFNEDGFFKIDRKYIEQQTSIIESDQLDFDSILSNLGVLEKDISDTSTIRVNLERMAQILSGEECVSVKTKAKVSRSQAVQNKQTIIINKMKSFIQEEDIEIKARFESFIDSIYASGRFLTKAKIQMLETGINTYTSDKIVKLSLLNIGIQTGWDNAEWLISRYEKSKSTVPSNPTIMNAPQIVSSGQVAKDIEF